MVGMRSLTVLVLLTGCGPMLPMPDAGHDAGVDAGFMPKLIDLPDCGTPDDAGFAQDIFDNVVSPNGCTAGGCHGPPPNSLYSFSDAKSMVTAWVDAGSVQSPLKRVVPGKPNESYVLYKVYGQQLAAHGLGEQMPQGGPYLSDAQLCAITNWVAAGAR
jgi:hypothetical protein